MRDNDVDCPPTRFVVRVRDPLSTRSRSLRLGPTATSAVVGGLRAGSIQRVRLAVDRACRHGRSKASRWLTVRLPATTGVASASGRITKSVRDLQARDRVVQRQKRTATACLVL